MKRTKASLSAALGDLESLLEAVFFLGILPFRLVYTVIVDITDSIDEWEDPK